MENNLVEGGIHSLSFVHPLVENLFKQLGKHLRMFLLIFFLYLQLKQVLCRYIKKLGNNESCSLIAWRRERISGPIFAVFLPCLYVLLTANNTHSR